eukprot:7807255-Heterocapsa_arctica.AAC.1
MLCYCYIISCAICARGTCPSIYLCSEPERGPVPEPTKLWICVPSYLADDVDACARLLNVGGPGPGPVSFSYSI